jgi:hypothetical protein
LSNFTLKEIFKVSTVPVVVASLCCLSPLVLVLVGLSTVSFATTLADTLYGTYKWYFRIGGLVSLFLALLYHFRISKGVCTLDQVKKRRNEILNFVILSLTAGIAGYFFFLYVVVHYAGVALKIWE